MDVGLLGENPLRRPPMRVLPESQHGWVEAQPSRPGAYDTVIGLAKEERVELLFADGRQQYMTLPPGETQIHGLKAFRVVRSETLRAPE